MNIVIEYMQHNWHFWCRYFTVLYPEFLNTALADFSMVHSKARRERWAP